MSHTVLLLRRQPVAKRAESSWLEKLHVLAEGLGYCFGAPLTDVDATASKRIYKKKWNRYH